MHDAAIHLDREDIDELHNWSGGQFTSVYALASSSTAGHAVTREMIDDAVSELSRDLSRERQYLDQPRSELDDADRADVLDRIASLETLIDHLEMAESLAREGNPVGDLQQRGVEAAEEVGSKFRESMQGYSSGCSRCAHETPVPERRDNPVPESEIAEFGSVEGAIEHRRLESRAVRGGRRSQLAVSYYGLKRPHVLLNEFVIDAPRGWDPDLSIMHGADMTTVRHLLEERKVPPSIVEIELTGPHGAVLQRVRYTWERRAGFRYLDIAPVPASASDLSRPLGARRDNPTHSFALRTAPAEVENPSEDEHQGDMLAVAADSEGTLYPLKKQIIANIAKHRHRGDYDSGRAAQAFSYYIDAAAKLLAQENQESGEDARSWVFQYPKRVRRHAAQVVAQNVEAELLVGEREARANAEIFEERSPLEGGHRRNNPLYPAVGPKADMHGRASNPAGERSATGESGIPLKLLQPRVGNPLADGCSQETISGNIGRELHAHPDMPVAQGVAIAYSHARAQGCRLPKHKTRKGNPDELRVAETIAEQLGGTGKLVAMIGAKDFVASKDALQFKWAAKAKNKANTVRIVLTPNDLYDVTFYRVGGGSAKELNGWEEVQASELRPLFEKATGLHLSLGSMGS